MPFDHAGEPLDRRQLFRRLGGVGTGAKVGAGPQAAAAGSALDVQILQTASSLERVAITVYGAARELAVVKASPTLVNTFISTSLEQHMTHIQALQARTVGLGGQIQDAPDPRYATSMTEGLSGLRAAADVIGLLVNLETVLRDTYLSDVAMMSDPTSKGSVGSVLGVEAQHLATLRIMGALLAAHDTTLVAAPVAATALPAAVGNAGFPDGPFPIAAMASPPGEGAIS